MNRISSKFHINRIMRRTAVGVLSTLIAAGTFAARTDMIMAAENDGLIYGTSVDDCYGDSAKNTGSTSSGSGTASDTSQQKNASSAGSDASDNSASIDSSTSSASSSSSDDTITKISEGDIFGSSSSVSIDYTDDGSTDTSNSIIDSDNSGTYVSSDGLILGSVSVAASSSADSGSSSSGENQTSTAGASASSWLIYGSIAADIFGSGSSAGTLSIENGSASNYTYTSYVGTDTSFNQSYTALEIYVYLRNQGFSSASACGVLGNIMRESSMDPTAYNAGGDSYGLFQCTGSLKTRQENYCTSHGLSVADAMAQTESMILDTAPDLFTLYGKNANNITYDQFKQLSDPRYAAEVWRAVVERNNYSAQDTAAREDYAQGYYNKWANYDGSGFDIIEEALKYVGNPYVWGGDSLTMGIDCSHFVCKILTITGHYSDSYRTSLNLRTVGTEVSSISQAEPGDILCWEGHVALYITDGYYVNAANSRDGICVGGGDIATKLGGLITIRRVR